jgi:hypothetical protein
VKRSILVAIVLLLALLGAFADLVRGRRPLLLSPAF